ncbi:hypothetical protein RZS08_02220, partial [Arthrospira platensis SPKY1]|nr:hypothetical protein [Arthrospira platensis SPKY1]
MSGRVPPAEGSEPATSAAPSMERATRSTPPAVRDQRSSTTWPAVGWPDTTAETGEAPSSHSTAVPDASWRTT